MGRERVLLVNLFRPPSEGEPCCCVGRFRSAVVLVVIFVVFIYLFVCRRGHFQFYTGDRRYNKQVNRHLGRHR